MNDKKIFHSFANSQPDQEDNADARDGINKSVVTICNEEGISFGQVFYILFFDAVFISNKSSFSLYFDQLLE